MAQLILIVAAIALAIAFIQAYWHIVIFVILAILAVLFVPLIVRNIRKNIYFSSKDFKTRKDALAALIVEHNEIADYAKSIRDNELFAIGFSSSGKYAHLASSQNTSTYRYRRDRNVAHFNASNVHNCSLQVVRNAAQSPINHLIKYFHVDITEDCLAEVESLGEHISRLEDAIENLRARELSITETMTPPGFIIKYFRREFMQHVGVQLTPIDLPYPIYIFEYVSAGGNSSQRTTVRLDIQTIDTLIETLSTKIWFRKSAAGQRALMTAKLREHIKQRDNYACNYCGVSLSDEPHLLLEVDHIIPVSKGGASTETNLQTLCWRCNRTKSSKVGITVHSSNGAQARAGA